MASKRIPLPGGHVLKCDEEDYEVLRSVAVRRKLVSGRDGKGHLYCFALMSGRQVPLTRFVVVGAGKVSFRNGDSLDLRRSNLVTAGKRSGARRALSVEEHRAVINASGISDREMARKYGVTTCYIANIRKYWHLEPSHPKGKRADAWLKRRILAAPELDNYTLGEIFGVSHVAILKLKRRLGIPPRPRGRPRLDG